MFGAEPQQSWTEEESLEFEAHASQRMKHCLHNAAWAAAAFCLNVLAIIPFAAGQPLHRYWEHTKFLVLIAMLLWLWLVYKVALVWSSWQSSRDVRQESGERQ